MPLNFDTVMRLDAVDDYPSSPLAACVKDADRFERLFNEVGGWPVHGAMKRFNEQVVNSIILPDLEEHVRDINSGFTRRSLYFKSGHGTEIPSPVGSKLLRSQLYCPHNIDRLWRDPSLVTDADYEHLFDSITDKSGKHIVMMLCCNSGGMLNTYLDDANRSAVRSAAVAPRVKYLKTPYEDAYALERNETSQARAYQRVSEAVFEDEDSNYVYWAATRSDTFAYEVDSPVYGHGDCSGLFLDHVIRSEPGISVRNAHRRVCEMIRDIYGFDQVPQLWGPKRLLDSDFFS